MMATPTTAQINAEIGNATRELSPPSACFKYNAPGDGYYCLEWLDDPAIQPTEAATMVKATELAEAELLPS
jgi:hypothetical protein